MLSFEQDHQYLHELLNVLELTFQYSFNCMFSTIDSILNQNEWNPEIDSPTIEVEEIDDTL